MQLVDLTYLQTLEKAQASVYIDSLQKILERAHVSGGPVCALLLPQAWRSLALKSALIDLFETNDFVYLDLADIKAPWTNRLLAQYLVARNVTDWWQLPGNVSQLPIALLSEVLHEAGVALRTMEQLSLADDVQLESPGVTEARSVKSTCRPSLAIIAPFPPTKSGIADYVAVQAEALQKKYELLLVVECNNEVARYPHFPGSVIAAEDFVKQPAWHRRVLFHLGNSPNHLWALELLKNVTGIVILHDFFLTDVLQYQIMQTGLNANAIYRAFIRAHGLAPLLKESPPGKSFSPNDYPCNLSVIEQARCVLVHSEYVMRLARQYYGDRVNDRIRQIPFARTVDPQGDRATAKATLGFKADDFLVMTFGFATSAKSLETIINAWVISDLHKNGKAHLIIVGEFLDMRYQERIDRLLMLNNCTNLHKMGFQDAVSYRYCLNACDLAVQLRTRSRGETSAALLDCLANGIPAIANHHGFVEDLPDSVLWKTSETPDALELAAALDALHQHSEWRQTIGVQAKQFVQQSYDPQIALAALESNIEAFVKAGQSETMPQIFEDIVNTPLDQLTLAARLRMAQAIVANQPPPLFNQLLIDITAIARFDLKTGIQRVVRALLRKLVASPPSGYRAMPVYLGHDGVYHYAHHFVWQAFNIPAEPLDDDVIRVYPGDIYLALDLHTTSTVHNAAIYQSWRQQGVRIVSVLYDLLPVRHPAWFPPGAAADFEAWARHIALNSDAVLAISRTVASDFGSWINEQKLSQSDCTAIDIGWFHLGSDIEASTPTSGLPEDAAELLDRLGQGMSFLMVGTIEPRKGHAQTLAAFEQLWAEGCHHNLVIVGKQGWHVEDLITKIRMHPELGRHLFWLEGISDEYLDKVYAACTALIAASEGEGFGLPLIEAARHQRPVIARDIPVFREVGGDGASYFHADNPTQLADFLAAWTQKQLPMPESPISIRCMSWEESADQLKDFLFNRKRSSQWVS